MVSCTRDPRATADRALSRPSTRVHARALSRACYRYVPHEDGRLYAIKDSDGDGLISEDEVSAFNTGNSFQASPALAPGMLVVAPCDGAAMWLS